MKQSHTSIDPVDLVQYIAMIVIRRTLLSNLNPHRTVIIQYHFASNSEWLWLFSCYFSIIFSLFTLVDYEE